MTRPVPFGMYSLLERINVGGMAEVFKAKVFGVEGFERLVAVKRILPNIAEDEEFITMFIDEAKIAAQLQHANIAQIFDLGKVEDSYFIALEYVHGKDLRALFDHLRKVGDRMPAAQVCYVMMQVCEGLDYAHNKRDSQGRELNLVHRDVSPQNVLVGYDGEIKLVDFGIAKAAGKASQTQAGILKGKFGYMSPEQVRGFPVDRRSDVFAVGICLYELLTGERLFVGESDFSTLEKVRNDEILPPSSFNKRIAPELERIVLKALAKEVEDRYQNAIDLHDDLQAYLYSIGEFYSRKDLASWMKKIFSAELAEGGQAVAQPPGLDWDREELETQIFNRLGEAGRGEEERDAEMSSSDILLGEGLGSLADKTAIAPPPDVAALAMQLDYAIAAESASSLAAAPYPGVGAASGPLPGLGAYRQSIRAVPRSAPPVARPGSRPVSVAVLATAGLLVVGFALWNLLSRPARLIIEVVPSDAVVQLDGVVLRGPTPIELERPPGLFTLAFSKEGYLKHEQTVTLERGEQKRVPVQLEASPDTGFVLTSDPPDQLVWLDGQPVWRSDSEETQARTDLRAYRIPPGPHRLEIKGDPRFRPWQHSFYQEPGRMIAIEAPLEPVSASGGAAHAPNGPLAASPPSRGRAACFLTIGSRPWAEIWVDGKNTGKLTPLADHQVACGRRRIRLRNPALQLETTQSVILREGETFKKTFLLGVAP